MLGLVGLGTEGGTWYLERRHGQNTADAAAMAGVLQLAAGAAAGSAAVTTSGTDAASRNGYTSGVTINSPYAGNANRVQAIVTHTPPKLFSHLFLNNSVTITERAVAELAPNSGPACMLALAGGLSFAGNTTITAPGCALASNEKTASSLSCTGSASVTAVLLLSSGGISGCGGTKRPYAPPTNDPFAAAQSVTMPPVAASSTKCQNMPSISGTVTLTAANTYEGGGTMFCTVNLGHGISFAGDLKITNGNTLNLAPGTYIFYDASIDMQGGLLQCPTCTSANGVTIILTGSPASSIGTIKINGNATVQLHAPPVNSFNAAFDGILFYMDKNAPNSGGGNSPVQINGGANTVLAGGMYFPSVDTQFNGNMSGGALHSTCTEIVGYSITLTGNSNLDISGCAAGGTKVPVPQSVHLVM